MENKAVEVYRQTKGWLNASSVVGRFLDTPGCLGIYLEGEEGEAVERLIR